MTHTVRVRPCPRCGTPPLSIYPARSYQSRDGRARTKPPEAYCSTCQRTYGINPGRRPARPAPLRIVPAKPKLIADHTLADVLADPDPWRHPSKVRRAHLAALVLERDHFRCQLNGELCIVAGELVVTLRDPAGDHHPNNLTSTCRPCLAIALTAYRCADCGSTNVRRRPLSVPARRDGRPRRPTPDFSDPIRSR